MTGNAECSTDALEAQASETDLTSDTTAHDDIGYRSVLLIALGFVSTLAGGLHLAEAGTHAAEWWVYGTFFVAVGCSQVVWGFVAAVQPTVRRLYLGAFLHLAVVWIWIMSRTLGVPGPDGTVIEDFEPIGLLAAVLEVGAALAALGIARAGGGLTTYLSRSTGARQASRVFIASGLVLILVAAAAATSAASSSGGGGHSHGGSGSEVAWREGTSACEVAPGNLDVGQVTANEGHMHVGPVAQEPLRRSERMLLAEQITIARQAAAALPTVADAKAAGYHLGTRYAPCVGSHWVRPDYAEYFDPARPGQILYDGVTDDAQVVGLSYIVYSPGVHPEGFAGPNDRWHLHGLLCWKTGEYEVIGDEHMTTQECEAIGGEQRPEDPFYDIWMLHAWVVPGWECSWGLFAPLCPELGGIIEGSAWD